MGLGTLTLMGMLWAPAQAAHSGVTYLNLSKMDIPIKFENKKLIREMLLKVSRNQGKTWEQYATARPDTDSSFTFTPPEDGLYWFQMVIVDNMGRQDPAEVNERTAPALKLFIDTKKPDIVIKSFDRTGDEATVSWDIQEANPDWSKFLVEYRIGDSIWTPIQAAGNISGTAKFRVAQAGPMTVRIQAVDLAGNRSEATKELAGTVSGPSPSGLQQSSVRTPDAPYVAPPTGGSDHSGVPIVAPEPAVRQEKPATTSGYPSPAQSASRNDPALAAPLAVSPGTPNPPTGIPLPAIQVINVARFAVAYDVEQKGPSGVSKAEVWVTRDDGRSWQKWSTTEKTESPVTVDLATKTNAKVEGVYGIKIVLLSGAGLSSGPPVSGDAPDMRVDVDLTPPLVKIYEPIPDPNQKDTMILRWQAVDHNLANDPITLEWAEQAEGPWNPIVSSDGGTAPLGSSAAVASKRLPNTGQYSWKLPSNFPTHRVYIRVTARDTAGNVGEVHSPHPILVDLNKPVAKIHGIIGAPAADK
jgi:hypothetical protein